MNQPMGTLGSINGSGATTLSTLDHVLYVQLVHGVGQSEERKEEGRTGQLQQLIFCLLACLFVFLKKPSNSPFPEMSG